MAESVTWIDDIEIAVEGPTIRATAISGGVRSDYRMGRATFRAYIERAIRQLNEADEAERCQILRFGRTG